MSTQQVEMTSEMLACTGTSIGPNLAALANTSGIVDKVLGHGDALESVHSVSSTVADAFDAACYSPSSVSSSPPLAPSETDGDLEPFTLDDEDDTWSTAENFTHASSINSTTPLIQSPEVQESYHFRNTQFDSVRTVIRPNPRYCPLDEYERPSPPCRPSTPESGSDSESSACPTPIEESIRLLYEFVLTNNFEEEVNYRQSEYVLEQAGCGRVEIWVTRERETFSESEKISEPVEHPAPLTGLGERPRVFFPPVVGRAH